jgi:hypothetical protein
VSATSRFHNTALGVANSPLRGAVLALDPFGPAHRHEPVFAKVTSFVDPTQTFDLGTFVTLPSPVPVARFEESVAASALSLLANPFDRFQQAMDLTKNPFPTPSVLTFGSTGIDATRFAVPTFQTFDSLNAATDLFRKYETSIDRIAQAIEGISVPWLDKMDMGASLTAFTRLQGIGNLVTSGPTFDRRHSAILRESLGDFRDKITWPEGGLDYAARTDLYLERGFDPDLVDFPEVAFEEAIELAGLALLGEMAEPRAEEDSEAVRLTLQFHQAFFLFENRLRRFIELVMSRTFGDDWMRQRLPRNMLDDWMDRRCRDNDRAAPIDYAHLNELSAVILKGDNWQQAFLSIMGSNISVQESFQRLQTPARNAYGHSRIMGREDIVLATAEMRRIDVVMVSIRSV